MSLTYSTELLKSSVPSLSVDCVVVGSGVGGLTTAALLAKTDKVSVVVLERSAVAGGATHAFQDKGFRFEIGLQECGAELWRGLDSDEPAARVLGRATSERVSWVRVPDAPYVAYVGDAKFTVRGTWEELRADLVARFGPKAEAKIDEYRRRVLETRLDAQAWILSRLPPAAYAVPDASAVHSTSASSSSSSPSAGTAKDGGGGGGGDDPAGEDSTSPASTPSAGRPKALSIKRAWNALIHGGGSSAKDELKTRASRFAQAASRTVHDVLDEIFCGDFADLAYLLTFLWGKYGLPPQIASWGAHCLVAGAFLDGAAYPQGGAAAIERALVDEIHAHGGFVFVGAVVEGLFVERGAAAGVRMADGTVLRAKRVVSAIGAANTYERLVPRALVSPATRTSLTDLKWSSYAILQCFLGFRGSPAELKLPTSAFWFLPSDSTSHTENAVRYFLDATFKVPFPYIHVSFPSAKDPDATKSTCVVYAAAHFDWFKGMGPDDVKGVADEIVARLTEKLYEVFPQLRQVTEFVELATPLSHEFHLGASRGAALGLGLTPARFDADWLKPVSQDVPGLVLAGQDVLTPTVANAAVSGYMAAAAAFPEITRRAYAKDEFFFHRG